MTTSFDIVRQMNSTATGKLKEGVKLFDAQMPILTTDAMLGWLQAAARALQL